MGIQPAPKARASLRMRASTFALCVLTVWPAAHFAIAERYDLFPWKFFGFAMYAVAEPGMSVKEPMAAAPGGTLKVIPLHILPTAVRDQVYTALAGVLAGRKYWGRLFEPRVEAAALLDLMPSASVVVLSLDRCELDHAASVRCRAIQYRCTREQLGRAACSATAGIKVGSVP